MSTMRAQQIRSRADMHQSQGVLLIVREPLPPVPQMPGQPLWVASNPAEGVEILLAFWDDGSVTAVARHFAGAGVAVACVNYRLSPLAKYPAGIADAAAAFAWVKQHIAEHGGDPARLFLGGHSAGGYLTLMVGLDARYLKANGLDPSAIAGLIPVAGQTLTHYSIREERGLPKDRIIADEAAPLHHVNKDAPPMLILYAENDMAMRAQENELLAAALRQAGHTGTTVRMIKGHDHGSVGNALALPGDEGFTAVMKFILPEKPDRP